MKKIPVFVLALSLVLSLAACAKTPANDPTASNTPEASTAQAASTAGGASNSSTVKPDNATTAANKDPFSVDATNPAADAAVERCLRGMEKSIKFSNVEKKAAEMIGAQSGKGFRVGDKNFELYYFKDKSKLEEAKGGVFHFNAEGYGVVSMKCSVNSNFLLLYETADQTVIDAFKAVQ